MVIDYQESLFEVTAGFILRLEFKLISEQLLHNVNKQVMLFKQYLLVTLRGFEMTSPAHTK